MRMIKSPERKRRDAKRRKRQEQNWARKSGAVTIRYATVGSDLAAEVRLQSVEET